MLCLQERSFFIIGIAQAESIICNDMDIQYKDISVLHGGYSSRKSSTVLCVIFKGCCFNVYAAHN